MMKKIIVLLLIFISAKSVSQIYFGANTAMYVKNQVLYVDKDINLSTNSHLYLRNNSQLVQGTVGSSTNTGTGLISIYQEGTSDNFDYNYWCSPVGNASVSTGNEKFGISMLYRPTSSIASTLAIILPIGSYNGIANPLSIASQWIYKLNNANNYSQWIFVGGTTTLASGEGFTMKGTGGTDTTDPEGTGLTNNPGGLGAQRYDFRGKANDGNISIAVSLNNATLTGNPYPSALHLNAFLLDPSNTASGGVAYFWEQDKTVNSHYITDYKGGYGTYSPMNLASSGIYVPATFNSYNGNGSLNMTGTTSGLLIQRKYSPIGQGFVINGASNGTLTFKNAHRIYYREGNGYSQFEKPSKPNKKFDIKETVEKISYFKLNAIINNQFTRQLALAFLPEATDGIDLGIDALNMDDSLPNDTYFVIDNNHFVIQGINFDITKKIPLAVKATTNITMKFYIPEIVNFDSNQPVFLYDALDGSYHDIKNETYEIIIPAGTYLDRFKITFKTENLGLKEENVNNFFINQNNPNHTLKIYNPDHITLKSFALFDITGRIIISKKNLGSDQNYNFSTSELSSGIYIANFITIDNEKFSQKILVSNYGK